MSLSRSRGIGRNIGIAIGTIIGVIVGAVIIGSTYQNKPVNPAPILKGNPNDSLGGATLVADITYGKDPISVGNIETIIVTVNNGNVRVNGASVNGIVTSDSGFTMKAFSGTTNTNGEYSYSWKIDDNSNTGIFNVEINVSYGDQSLTMPSSFIVIEA